MCMVCNKSFSQSSALRAHHRIHTGERPFRCTVCEKSFSKLSTLREHQRTHTGEKPFRCEVCDKSFSVSSTLRVHQRVHTGEKPFICKVCDKSFSDSSTFRAHQHVHTGEKPFSCEVCDKSFSQSSHLYKHQRTHTGKKSFMYEVYDNSFSCSSTLHQRQRNYTEEKPLPCKVNLAYNVQELSLTGGWVPYMKELTEQEEFTRKLFYLSNPTITNGGSDMGMNEDTQVSMSTSDGDGGELAAAFQIPGRADEEWMEVNTSQQYGMAAAVEDGEEYLEGSVDELNLNIVTCVKEEPCDDLAAVMEGGRLEPSRNEESAALGAEAPLASQARGQHHAYAASKENEDDLKPLERFHQEQVESTENYKATSNLLQQTLVEFKTDIRQNLQRDNEILQQHLQRNNEILERYLQNDNQILKQHLQRNNAILQQHLQRNKAILQQQNEFFCHILQ